jgi:ketosteroid isomerase-like protein
MDDLALHAMLSKLHHYRPTRTVAELSLDIVAFQHCRIAHYDRSLLKEIFMTNEQQIRALIEAWAMAVRRQEVNAVLANHSDNIVMFDVPPPFKSVGIDAYRKTWDLFFANAKTGVFDIQTLDIFAGEEIAFCVATMRCEDCSEGGPYKPLDFRLTVGLSKLNDQWVIVHEHHSIPAE